MSDVSFERIRLVDAKPLSSPFRPMDNAPLPASREAETQAPPPGPDLYALGHEAGIREAAAAFAIERAELLALIENAQALQSEPSDELAVLIGETVASLVTTIVGDVAIDADWLGARANAAAALITDCDNARTMWVHPDDLVLLRHARLPLDLMPDPEAQRGSIRIDCSAGWIEAGTALYLDTLRGELGITRGAA